MYFGLTQTGALPDNIFGTYAQHYWPEHEQNPELVSVKSEEWLCLKNTVFLCVFTYFLFFISYFLFDSVR